jgi:hypothetical protein
LAVPAPGPASVGLIAISGLLLLLLLLSELLVLLVLLAL